MVQLKHDTMNNIVLRQERRIFDRTGDVPVVSEEFFVEDAEYTYYLAGTIEDPRGKGGIVTYPYKSKTRALLKSIVKFPLRDYQVECANFILGRLKSKMASVRVMITLDPGKGKTYVSTYILSKYNKRFSVVVLAQYIEKWIGDLTSQLNVTEEDIYIVQGGASLAKLMKMKKKDIPKIVIYSNRTLVSVMKSLVDGSYSDKYSMALSDLMRHTNTDLILLDEAHEEFNSIHKCMTIMNPNRILGLSATFDSDRYEFKSRMLEMFPLDSRINPLSPDKYRNVISMHYPFRMPSNFNVVNWHTKFYSHIEFEKSILKNRKLTEAYLFMIGQTYRKYRDNGKFLIFVASLAMIGELQKYFKRRFPEKNISKYTGGDPLTNLMDAEVCFSTLGSSGTALDIPNLSKVLMTVSLSSTNANIQAFGRLRELTPRDTSYIYMWTNKIEAQEKHHLKRLRLHKPYAKNTFLTEDNFGI